MDFMKLKKLMILTKRRVIDILALEKEYKKAMKNLEKELEAVNDEQE